MKTRYILLSFLAGMSVFFSSSCSLGGLEPFSGKHAQVPQITMQLSQFASGEDGSVSRAIVQGDGFIYIRTLGGPTGDKGPFYGPYPVKAHTDFTTSDIPAGQYTSMMILYSGETLDGTKLIAYNGVDYSVSSLLALPDADFNSFAGTDTSTATTLGDYFDGKFSYGEQKSVTLESGKTTNISMTLIPITGSSTSIDLSKNISHLFSSATPIKQFYRIDGISVTAGKVLKSVTCNFIGISGTTNNLQQVAFYDRSGKLLTSTKSGTDLAGEIIYTLDEASCASIVDAKGYVELYLYLDYLGSINATFGYSGTGIAPVSSAVSVGIILPSSSIPRWNQDLASMASAFGSASVSFECMYSNEDTATELANAQALIAKGIKVLIITPIDSANCPAAAAAKAAGVKVIAYDILITGSSNIDYYISFDNYVVGQMQGAYLLLKAGAGTGLPLFLYAGNYSDANAHTFFRGAWSVLQPAIASGTFVIKNSIVADSFKNNSVLADSDLSAIIQASNSIDTKWDWTTTLSLATRDLAANPGLVGAVYFLAPNDVTARAIISVFYPISSGTMYITGQDAEKDSVQSILNDKQSMTILKDARTLGVGAVTMAIQLIMGTTPTTTSTVDNGVLNVPSLLLPSTQVLKADVRASLIDTGYYSASDFTGLP